MLKPKRIKFNKYHRRKLKISYKKNIYTFKNILYFGTLGLIANEYGSFTARQIEIFRRTVRKHIQKKGTIFSCIFPDLPITKKPLATRIGKGKGNISYWTSKIYPGIILIELSGVSFDIGILALKKASKKLSFKTKIIKLLLDYASMM